MSIGLASGARAQTIGPRDSTRPPAEIAVVPNASPRDAQDRRDPERDRTDADLAIERDKCGDLSDDAKERCIRDARAQRDQIRLPNSARSVSQPRGPAN